MVEEEMGRDMAGFIRAPRPGLPSAKSGPGRKKSLY